MFFWNSLAFSMIQQMLAIWSLVPLPFLKPAWTNGSSQFIYCWGQNDPTCTSETRGWAQNCRRVTLAFGEGTSTPLQYSCLENPMDGGAWWAAVHGVAKSRTRRATSLSCIGEGNGNPLQQCSCLENPRDGGAWWAAVYGVAQSQSGTTEVT